MKTFLSFSWPALIRILRIIWKLNKIFIPAIEQILVTHLSVILNAVHKNLPAWKRLETERKSFHALLK